MENERPRKRTRIRLPRRRRSQVLLVIAVVALAVVAFLLLRGGGDSGPQTLGGSPAPFSLVYPASWKPFNQAELAAFNQPPVAVLRQQDGKGILVLRVEKPFGGNLQKFALDLRKELDKRLTDFREVRTRVIKTKAGNAFFYSYIRTTRGTVHTIVVIPAGNQRSYALSSVSQSGANDVAREIGQMVTSFALTK